VRQSRNGCTEEASGNAEHGKGARHYLDGTGWSPTLWKFVFFCRTSRRSAARRALRKGGASGPFEPLSETDLGLACAPVDHCKPLPQPADQELALVREAGRVQLRGRSEWAPVCVDFLDPLMRKRRRGLDRRTHPLARAVGRNRPLPDVLDGTAGLGRDAFVLACLGYQVEAVERSPVLHALLADGLARLTAGPEGRRWIGDRLRLSLGECRERLAHGPPPEVVYLDPMFPERRKSALVKKEMQLFQALLGEDSDADETLALARQVARQRVVVKRPVHAPPLAADPSYAVRKKTVRWDVYLRPAGAPGPDDS